MEAYAGKSLDERVSILERDFLAQSHQVGAVEKTVERQAAQYSEIKTEIVRLEEGVKGIREQARAHYEKNGAANSNLTTLVGSVGKELQDSIDTIATSLGINEDEHAASSLRQSIIMLNKMRVSREETITWVRRGFITLILGGFATILIAGIKVLLVGHL